MNVKLMHILQMKGLRRNEDAMQNKKPVSKKYFKR